MSTCHRLFIDTEPALGSADLDTLILPWLEVCQHLGFFVSGPTVGRLVHLDVQPDELDGGSWYTKSCPENLKELIFSNPGVDRILKSQSH